MGDVALDGTKVRANASRHEAMSYQRMKEKEEQLAAEVAELLRRAQDVDEETNDSELSVTPNVLVYRFRSGEGALTSAFSTT